MALTATRTRLHLHIRRALTLSSLHRLPTTATTTTTTLLSTNPLSSQHQNRHRSFHTTHPSLAYSKSFNDVDKIDPDTILFEGCDYNHWLIVMDFGKDPQQYPPSDQMVETYVNTCSQVLGSVEEAKKKIYACSTTTYTGFQVEVDEETSKKFENLPGVVFVLPDSYIDPVNKEYGGDKYINGTIIPRPPPVQYGRTNRNRRNDQNSRGSFSQRGNPADYQHGSMSGEGRGHMPQRDHYQSGGNNFPPAQQNNNNEDFPSHRGNYNRGLPYHQDNYSHGVPTHQGNYNQGVSNHQGNYNHGVPTHQGNYNRGVPTHQGNYSQGYTQPHSINNFSGGDPGQVNNSQGDHGYNHLRGQIRDFRDNQGNYTPQGQAEYPATGRNYAPVPPVRGADGQTGVGSFEQSGRGRYGEGPSGIYGEGASVTYGPNNNSQLGDQRFSQGQGHYSVEATDHRNYSPADQAGVNQVGQNCL